MPVTLAELAKRFQGKVRGNPDTRIESVAMLETAGPHDIAYVSDRKYLELLPKTAAGAVILTETDADHFSGNVLLVENPHLCFARVASLLHPLPAFKPGIHATAVVSPKARVAGTSWIGPYSVIESEVVIKDGVWVGPGCYVGAHVLIASRTRLFAHVAVYDRCTIGEDCLIHSGVVIGSDGFGYSKDNERWQKVPQLGRAIIGNLVEIGANTTVDRGTLKDTVIGDGVKLDNQIQIAHNVQIGENTAIAACVGIAGSTVIGRRCTVGGQAGIVGHIEIADDVHVTAGSLVTNSIAQAGVYSASLKAEPVEKWRRNAARLHHLDEIARRLGKLEDKLQQLSKEQKN
jgi:UDP-3-O-[3-hydroxymyristoyl] glucosamine N-acyltransferase